VGLGAGSAQAYVNQQVQRAAERSRVRVRLSSFDLICYMVESGIGIAVVPEAAARPWQRAMSIRVVPIIDACGSSPHHLLSKLEISDTACPQPCRILAVSLPKTVSMTRGRGESQHDRRKIAIGLLFVRMLCDCFKPRQLSFPKIRSGLDSRREAESSHHPGRCLQSPRPSPGPQRQPIWCATMTVPTDMSSGPG
jgi:hypothetical protein